MARYFISFNDGDMQFPPEDLPDVAAAAHKVMHDAIAAGVWIVGGGFLGYAPRVVGTDGSVTPGALRESPVLIGGFTVMDVESESDALRWASRIAEACRCAQEIRAIMPDPEQETAQAKH